MYMKTIFKSIIIGIPVGVTLVDSIGYIARVDGISMQPALNPNSNQTDYVFLNRWSVKTYQIKRGDIIALLSPKDPTLSIIKRIVGIQGDIIETIGYKKSIVRVPEGHCWVEGDHTGHSMDSNNFGPVSLGLITARATCIVWPPSRWQFLNPSIPPSRIPLNLSASNMRAISLVNHIEFGFTGNVTRNAIILGDLDNDGCNELVIGSTHGDVAVFKDKKKLQVIPKLTFISCLAIGDIFNEKKNHLVIITADGWCYVYKAIIKKRLDDFEESPIESFDTVDGQVFSSGSTDGFKDDSSFSSRKDVSECEEEDRLNFICVHLQRIPANSKDILLADINDDGSIEMVLGLTDRVVRSYRWIPLNDNDLKTSKISYTSSITSDAGITVQKCLGKLVALNKWECASQIGSITLHHGIDGLPSLLIAQPGGTFMRIKCHNLETSDKIDNSSNDSLSSSSMVDYQYLGRSRMRSQNISTEILGDLKTVDEDELGGINGRPYVVATLDGTIMLVKNEEILWAMAVDHQIFALTKLDVTGSGSDEIVACAWDGQTYILDQDRNSVRFHFEQSVQAFTSGYYNLTSNEPAMTCFIYVTFKNTVVIYYDIPLKDLTCRKFEPDLRFLSSALVEEGKDEDEIKKRLNDLDKDSKKDLVRYLLYDLET